MQSSNHPFFLDLQILMLINYSCYAAASSLIITHTYLITSNGSSCTRRHRFEVLWFITANAGSTLNNILTKHHLPVHVLEIYWLVENPHNPPKSSLYFLILSRAKGIAHNSTSVKWVPFLVADSLTVIT